MVKRIAGLALSVSVMAAGCARTPKPNAPQPQPQPASAQPATPQAASPQPASPRPASPQPAAAPAPAVPALVPLPALVEPISGTGFTIGPKTVIVASGDPAIRRIAADTAERIRRATGLTLDLSQNVEPATGSAIVFMLLPQDTSLGAEGYDLSIREHQVSLNAR